jgi:hypothetical protein
MAQILAKYHTHKDADTARFEEIRKRAQRSESERYGTPATN